MASLHLVSMINAGMGSLAILLGLLHFMMTSYLTNCIRLRVSASAADEVIAAFYVD